MKEKHFCNTCSYSFISESVKEREVETAGESRKKKEKYRKKPRRFEKKERRIDIFNQLLS